MGIGIVDWNWNSLFHFNWASLYVSEWSDSWIFFCTRQYKTWNNNNGAVNEKAKLASGKWIQLEGGDLVIKDVDRNDSGKYTCFGRDDNNNIYAHAEVSVNCKYLPSSGAFRSFPDYLWSSGWLAISRRIVKYCLQIKHETLTFLYNHWHMKILW